LNAAILKIDHIRGETPVIKALPHIAEMSPYLLADLSVAAGKRPVMLAQNESLRPPSPKALQAAAVRDQNYMLRNGGADRSGS
jgi:hypothetical protein